MERSIMVEENRDKCDSSPITKSSGSLIRIDAISIDLAGAMDIDHKAAKCEHFSIRGYASEMRKKDISICLPFASDGDHNKADEQTNILPPLHVPKFRWWRCQNCLYEIGAISDAEESGIVPDHSESGLASSNACSHMQSPCDKAMMMPDSQCAAPFLDINTSTKLSREETLLASGGYNKEKKDELGNTAIIGDNVNQEISHQICDETQSNPCFIQENHADGSDTLRVRNSGLVEFSEPRCRNLEAASTQKVDLLGNNSTQICQIGSLTPVDDGQRIVSMACETPDVVDWANKGANAVKGKKSASPSVGSEEHDGLSTESAGILAENSDHEQHHGNSSGLISQKSRKVRLLTEILGPKTNAENDHVRADGASSSVKPNESAWLDSISAPRGKVIVQGVLKKHFSGPKGKRKLPQDRDLKSLGLICPGRLTKKAKVFKGDASAQVNLQAGVRSQLTQYRIDKIPPLTKKKNKKTQVKGVHSPLMSKQEAVSKTNQIKFRAAEKHYVSADGSFSQLGHDVLINRGMEPYSRSILSTEQAERKYCLSSKKHKQVEAGQACLMLQTDSILGDCSRTRKPSDILENEPEIAKFQSAYDESFRKGLDLPLNSYVVAQRNEKSRVAKIQGGIDPLLPQWKNTLREDRHQVGDNLHFGESSLSHKSAPDLIFRKGFLFDLNEKVASHRTSPLHEKQNLVPWVEDGSFSLHQQLNFSGSSKGKNPIDIPEKGNDDIPMEIVELMARNQYERCRHEAERNSFLSGQTNDKRHAEVMSFPRVHRNGVLRSLHEENPCMRPTLAGMGMGTPDENVGSSKRKPVNCFSEIHRNQFNMGQWKGKSAFSGFGAYSHCREKKSGGLQISDSGSIRNGNSQNCKWEGDKVESRFFSTKFPVLESYNLCQNSQRNNEEIEHERSSFTPKHMPLGLNIPQKYATQSSNSGTHSQFPNTLLMSNIDLNVMKQNGKNLECPFVCKHGGIDLNAKVSESDLHTNETIPAMQLLSLMDAGMKSSSSFSLDGKSKFFTKPFVPCNHHSKFSLDGSSKILEKPLFSYDHQPKEFSGRGNGTYSDVQGHQSSAFYGKSHLLEKSCECSAAVPAAGSFASLFESDGNSKRVPGFKGQFPSKPEEQGKTLPQKRGRKSQKPVCKSGISLTNHDSDPVEDKRKAVNGAPNNMVFPFRSCTMEDSTRCIYVSPSRMNGTVNPLASISKNGICSINQNPADFTIPEARNVYMISGKDLKLKKSISSESRSGLVNMGERKQKRVTKPKAMKENAPHHTSRKCLNAKNVL